MKKKGFTLIELLAVIVILAIIALIATPIVLNIISDSKESARERTLDNIVHSAEIAYAKQQGSANASDVLSFNLSDENNGLEFNGERPKGIITVYPKGQVYLNVEFEDGTTYIKVPDSQEINKNQKIIGQDIIWSTDGNGTITKFNSGLQYIDPLIFSRYVQYIYSFVTSSNIDNEVNNYLEDDMSLPEFINLFESELLDANFNREFLTNKTLNAELDVLIGIFDVESTLTEEELNKILENNKTKIPYAIDVIEYIKENELSTPFDVDNCIYLKAYNLVATSFDNSFFMIPNYVMHENGELEKIKAIGDLVFVDVEDKIIHSTINNLLINKKPSEYDIMESVENIKGIDLIIPEGIESVGENAFMYTVLKSLNLPNSMKEIGNASFSITFKLNNLYLPDSLEKIGDAAFGISGITGNLEIPKNVKSIGESAFFGEEVCDSTDHNYDYCLFRNKYRNNLSSLVFKDVSKVETIGNYAFAGNSISQLTLPTSIKNIGEGAFYMNTLRNVIIKKSEGVDLTIGTNAFGNASVIYQP